jgi:hypothetical protein
LPPRETRIEIVLQPHPLAGFEPYTHTRQRHGLQTYPEKAD